MSPSPDHSPRRRWSELRETARRIDAEPRLVEGLRRLRRRLPGDEKFGDPLSASGETPAAYLARGLAALRHERESAAGELSLAGLQLWQSLSEATGRGRGDRELALLYTDLVEYSSWALDAGDTVAVGLLTDVGEVLEAAIGGHGGQITKKLGDGLVATFLDVRSAVDAALDAHAAMAGIEVDGYRPRMRAGVHWGRPRKLGGDYLGVDVTLAAEVGEQARAGQLLVSAPALEQLGPHPDGLRVGRRKRLRRRGPAREVYVATLRPRKG